MESLIYDRTLSDITNLTRKGQYNASDLNRVESWTNYLNDKFNEMGYNTTGYKKKPSIGEVEYIESTGTQYIDGISLSSNFRFEFDVMLYETTTYYNLYDAGSGTGNMLWITGDNSPAGANKLEFNTNATKVDITMNVRHKIVVDNTTSCVLSVDGAVKQTLTKVSNNLNFSLFNREGSQCFKGKIYGLKIYDNNVLVRDYIPAIDSNGVVCLYDKVSKTYFYNKGTGNFVAGERVSNEWKYKDDFILSEANRIINNINILKNIIRIYNDTPQTPETMCFLDYIKANDIEKILFDIDRQITAMKRYFIKAGVARAGQSRMSQNYFRRY